MKNREKQSILETVLVKNPTGKYVLILILLFTLKCADNTLELHSSLYQETYKSVVMNKMKIPVLIWTQIAKTWLLAWKGRAPSSLK